MRKNFITLLFFIGLIIFLFVSQLQKQKLVKKGFYSICKITEIKKGSKGSYNAVYKYVYKNTMYESLFPIQKQNINIVGRRFIVRFLPDDPAKSEILFDKRIWCDSLRVPYNGWKEIPEYFPFYPESESLSIKNCEMYKKGYIEKLKNNLKID